MCCISCPGRALSFRGDFSSESVRPQLRSAGMSSAQPLPPPLQTLSQSVRAPLDNATQSSPQYPPKTTSKHLSVILALRHDSMSCIDQHRVEKIECSKVDFNEDETPRVASGLRLFRRPPWLQRPSPARGVSTHAPAFLQPGSPPGQREKSNRSPNTKHAQINYAHL